MAEAEVKDDEQILTTLFCDGCSSTLDIQDVLDGGDTYRGDCLNVSYRCPICRTYQAEFVHKDYSDNV